MIAEQVAEILSGPPSLFEGLGFFWGKSHRCFQSQQGVENRTQRIDVGPLIRRVGLPARLLGSHVAWCAYDTTWKREEVIF